MKNNRCRFGAAVLALVLCVSISPAVSAAGRHRGDDPSFRDTIAKIILKIRGVFGGVSANDDFPDPPRP